MDNQLEIGVVVKPQGIKGEVKVIPHVDGPAVLEDIDCVFIDGAAYAVESFRHDGKMAYIKLSGIQTRDDAEALRNKTVWADIRSSYKLPEGRYFIVDIIGCDVVDEAGTLIGKVADVLQSVAQDVYVVKMQKGSFMMPVVDIVVKDIDIVAKKITVDSSRLKEVALYED